MLLESKLSNFCRLNMPQHAITFLKEHISDKMNVFYKNSVCFRFAIDKNQPDLFRALLDYYKETRLDRNQDQEMYRRALDELDGALNYLKDNCVTSVEIRDLMRKYISFDTKTDLIDIRIKTKDVGLRVPCLDDMDTQKELDEDYVQLLLRQLRDMEHSLEVASKSMYMAQAAEQRKVISESIELLENQYDLEDNRISEVELEPTHNISQSFNVLATPKLDIIKENTQEYLLSRVDQWLQSLSALRHESDIITPRVDDRRAVITAHRSHSEPDFIQPHATKRMVHSSSESLVSMLDSFDCDEAHVRQGRSCVGKSDNLPYDDC